MTPTIQETFDHFHAENPSVYELFKQFASELLAVGVATLSSKLIFERMRWETAVTTIGDSFKLNDHFTAHYARLWNGDNPEAPVRFNTRKLISQ